MLKDYQPAMLTGSALGSRKSSPRISTTGIGFKKELNESERADTPTLKLDGSLQKNVYNTNDNYKTEKVEVG